MLDDILALLEEIKFPLLSIKHIGIHSEVAGMLHQVTVMRHRTQYSLATNKT